MEYPGTTRLARNRAGWKLALHSPMDSFLDTLQVQLDSAVSGACSYQNRRAN
jgi:hypothetical protein